jgi:hypothetical protein
MTISQESATRLADYHTALSNNASLGTAILWLRQHTPASRLTDMEVSEIIRDATAAGVMTFKWGGTTIP